MKLRKKKGKKSQVLRAKQSQGDWLRQVCRRDVMMVAFSNKQLVKQPALAYATTRSL